VQVQQPELRSYEYIAAAASAKLVAASLTYPHEVFSFFPPPFLSFSFFFSCLREHLAAAGCCL
jgi:hypothetical protein